jgi:phosphotransferase system  glucose/maltose/N-acetylglucosamine-specific IIC component
MQSALLYIGPGLGVATIVIVVIVLLIILASVLMVLWTPIKSFIRRAREFFHRSHT